MLKKILAGVREVQINTIDLITLLRTYQETAANSSNAYDEVWTYTSHYFLIQ